MQVSNQSFQKHSSPALGINDFTGRSKLSWKRIWANSQHPHPKQKGSHNNRVVGGRSPSCIKQENSSENLSKENEGKWNKATEERKRLRSWYWRVFFPQQRVLPRPSCPALPRSHSMKSKLGSKVLRGTCPGAGAKCNVLTPQSNCWGQSRRVTSFHILWLLFS